MGIACPVVTDSKRQSITFIGNCQLLTVGSFYKRLVAPATGEDVVLVNPVPSIEPQRGAIASSDIVIAQRADFTAGLSAALAPHANWHWVPFLSAGFLWPFAGRPHPKNRTLDYLPNGPFGLEIGDSYLNRMIQDGVPPDEAVERYLNLDIVKRANLDRVFELWHARQQKFDAQTGWNSADSIASAFRDEQLFLNANHPNLRLFQEFCRQLLERLGLPASTVDRAVGAVRRSPFLAEAPIHPAVAEHFRLSWLEPGHGYRLRHEGRFTFEEFARRYMAFEWNEPLSRALALVDRGELAEAEEGLREGLARSPHSAVGHAALSDVAMAKGDAEAALTEARLAVELDSNDPSARLALAKRLIESGDYPAAETELRACLDLAPNVTRAARMLADVLARTGRASEAAGTLEAALEYDPGEVHLRMHLARLLAGEGRVEQSEAVLRAGLERVPDSGELYFELATLLSRAGAVEDALAFAKEAVRCDPSQRKYHAILGHLLLVQKDYAAAEKPLRRAVELEPANPAYRNSLGVALLGQRRYKEALPLAEQLAGEQPNVAKHHWLLGCILANSGELAAGEASVARAAALDPAEKAFQATLSQLRDRRARAESARPMPSPRESAARAGPELHWLPAAADWRERLAAVEAETSREAAWQGFAALATTRLDFLKLGRLDIAYRRVFEDAPPPGLTSKPVRLAILGSCSTGHLLPGIRIAALRRQLWVKIHEAGYGQYRQELADGDSGLHRFEPTVILFALDAYHLMRGLDPAAGREQADRFLTERLQELQQLWRTAREACSGQVIQQVPLNPFAPLLGSNEHRMPGSPQQMLARFNAGLRELADEAGIDLLTLDSQVAACGTRAWHDPALWHLAKQEISPAAAPMYGELVARLLAARQGRSRKCLVLDLDNTLWGGVIGDDGLSGIALGQGSGKGEAFAAFQAYVRDLSGRGVVLAVCSKNDEANALAPFENHPEMVLRRSDIAAFAANWADKAQNVRALARQLDLGLDALVFVDDNPFERELLRAELPEVAVPELPDDPALFAQCLADAGYFEGVQLTAEDRQRSGLYQTGLLRASLEAQAADLPAYLRSLDMKLVCKDFDEVGLPRIVQLINKTNQFNLTTRRYSEAEIADFMREPSSFGLQCRLSDRFGDNGMISVVMVRAGGEGELRIDSWLMSCRVLGRQVEEAVMNVVAAEAKRHKVSRLIGEYRPTARNGMVKEHYARLGFDNLAQAADGSSLWQLDLSVFQPRETFIVVEANR